MPLKLKQQKYLPTKHATPLYFVPRTPVLPTASDFQWYQFPGELATVTLLFHPPPLPSHRLLSSLFFTLLLHSDIHFHGVQAMAALLFGVSLPREIFGQRIRTKRWQEGGGGREALAENIGHRESPGEERLTFSVETTALIPIPLPDSAPGIALDLARLFSSISGFRSASDPAGDQVLVVRRRMLFPGPPSPLPPRNHPPTQHTRPVLPFSPP